MKYELLSFVNWINSDPRRVYFLMLLIAVMFVLVASAFPSSMTVAGWAAGGSDSPH